MIESTNVTGEPEKLPKLEIPHAHMFAYKYPMDKITSESVSQRSSSLLGWPNETSNRHQICISISSRYSTRQLGSYLLGNQAARSQGEHPDTNLGLGARVLSLNWAPTWYSQLLTKSTSSCVCHKPVSDLGTPLR